MDQASREKLSGFSTTRLMDALETLDELRGVFDDQEDGGPMQERRDLLNLHTLAMAVIHEGRVSRADDLFNRADDLSLEIHSIIHKLDSIAEVLDDLSDLRPEHLEL